MSTVQEKSCEACGEMKPVSEFRRHWNSPDGYVRQCNDCYGAIRARHNEKSRLLAAERAAERERELAFFRTVQRKRREHLYPSGQLIYALVDERDGAVRYVGRTARPGERASTHRRGRTGNTPKDEWVRELRVAGLTPIVQELETVVGDEFVLERELRWICHYVRAGADLFNAEARDSEFRLAVVFSPCTDFLTEPRTSSLLDAIPGWSTVRAAGGRWGHKKLSLHEAIKWCAELCPSEMPAEYREFARTLGCGSPDAAAG